MRIQNKLAFAAVAVAVPVLLGLTSCKDDNKKTETPASQQVAGSYGGTLDVTLAGQPVESITGQAATITVTQTGSTVKLQLTQSPLLDQFFGSQPIGAEDVTVVKNSDDTFTLAGSGKVSMGATDLDITVAGKGKPNAMQFTISVPAVAVVATFNGSRK